MAGSNTYAYPTHANTREYCCATHIVNVPHRESLVNVYRKSWSPQSSRYRSSVGTFRCMVCVRRFCRSTGRWYAVRFKEGEEHAAAEKEEPRTSEEAHSKHPQHAVDMSCHRSQRENVCRSRRRTQTRQTTQPDRTAEAQKVQRNAEERGVSEERWKWRVCGVRCDVASDEG